MRTRKRKWLTQCHTNIKDRPTTIVSGSLGINATSVSGLQILLFLFSSDTCDQNGQPVHFHGVCRPHRASLVNIGDWLCSVPTFTYCKNTVKAESLPGIRHWDTYYFKWWIRQKAVDASMNPSVVKHEAHRETGCFSKRHPCDPLSINTAEPGPFPHQPSFPGWALARR